MVKRNADKPSKVIDIATGAAERLASEAFSRFARGNRDKVPAYCLPRRNALVALAFAWAAARGRAEIEQKQIDVSIELKQVLDEVPRDAVTGEPYPLRLAQSSRGAQASLLEAKREADAMLEGIERGLDQAATRLNFDAAAVRQLVGVSRSAPSAELDPRVVEEWRQITCEQLVSLLRQLEG